MGRGESLKMSVMITNQAEGEMPSLVVDRGEPLYGHLIRHGWKPWRFGEHGVTVVQKRWPPDAPEPDYIRFTPEPTGPFVAPRHMLIRLLHAIGVHLRDQAGIIGQEIPDHVAR